MDLSRRRSLTVIREQSNFVQLKFGTPFHITEHGSASPAGGNRQASSRGLKMRRRPAPRPGWAMVRGGERKVLETDNAQEGTERSPHPDGTRHPDGTDVPLLLDAGAARRRN